MSDWNKTQALSNDPNRTQLGGPPGSFDPNRTQLGGVPGGGDPNKTMMGTAPSLNVTQTIKPVQCPICKTFNPAGVMFCNECGLIFEMALPDDAFGAPAVQLPFVVDETGREHQIRPGETSVGREGDIQLVDGRISRRHAKFVSNQGSVTVEDLGSTNGTKVNGTRLAAGQVQPLSGGEKISFGGYEVSFALPGAKGGNTTQVFSSNKTAAMQAAPSSSDAPAKLVGEGKEFLLKQGSNSLGRKAENDVCIPDGYVSGKHAVIEVADDGVYFTDIGSTNGTMLGSVKLAANMRTKIEETDVIRLGSLEFRIVWNG